jgi:hypothetical protein
LADDQPIILSRIIEIHQACSAAAHFADFGIPIFDLHSGSQQRVMPTVISRQDRMGRTREGSDKSIASSPRQMRVQTMQGLANATGQKDIPRILSLGAGCVWTELGAMTQSVAERSKRAERGELYIALMHRMPPFRKPARPQAA